MHQHIMLQVNVDVLAFLSAVQLRLQSILKVENYFETVARSKDLGDY